MNNDLNDAIIALKKIKNNMENEIEMLNSHNEPEIGKEVQIELNVINAMLELGFNYLE